MRIGSPVKNWIMVPAAATARTYCAELKMGFTTPRRWSTSQASDATVSVAAAAAGPAARRSANAKVVDVVAMEWRRGRIRTGRHSARMTHTASTQNDASRERLENELLPPRSVNRTAAPPTTTAAT